MSGLDPIRRWLRRDPGPAGTAGLGLAAPDVAELEAVGAEVEADFGQSSPAVLSANLTRLLRRRVPVRAVCPSQGTGLGGLRFADGTVVLVRGRCAGDLGVLAARLHRGPVQLADFHSEDGRVVLQLVSGGHTDQLRVLGVTGPA